MNTQESIVKIRKEVSMTTREFGDALGISHSYVAQLEAGDRKPGDEVAEKIKQLAAKAKIKVRIEYDKKFRSLHID